MDIRVYTDDKYVPLNQLASLGKDIIAQAQQYRQRFLEVIQVDDLNFVNIVETPALIKKRYIKNVQLKGMIDLEADNNDFILELAKQIVRGKKIDLIDIPEIEKLRNLYRENDNDLTIITNYLTNKIDELIDNKKELSLDHLLPGMSKFEIKFIEKFNQANHFYTLHDFQELNNTSYETARKSLEKLTKLNLYTKEKIGKKYIYKPTIKLTTILKGGV